MWQIFFADSLAFILDNKADFFFDRIGFENDLDFIFLGRMPDRVFKQVNEQLNDQLFIDIDRDDLRGDVYLDRSIFIALFDRRASRFDDFFGKRLLLVQNKMSFFHPCKIQDIFNE